LRAHRIAGAALDYLPFSFDSGFIASPVVELLVDDELGAVELGVAELEDDDELGDVELGVDVLDDAVELGVDDVSVDDDELLVVGGVAGIDGVVVLDELLDVGGVAGTGTVVSLFCWQPVTAARTAAAAAVIMNRFIMAPLYK